MHSPATEVGGAPPLPSEVRDHPSADRRRDIVRLAWWLIAAAAAIAAVAYRDDLLDLAARATQAIAEAAPGYLMLAGAATVLSVLLSAVVRQRTLRAAGGTARLGPTAVAGVESGAIQLTTPAGGIVSTGYLFRRFTTLGSPAPAVAWSLAVTGAVTSTMVIAMTTVGFTIGAAPSARNLAGSAALVMVLAGASVWVVGHAEKAAAGAARILTAGNRLLRRAPDTGVQHLRTTVTALGEVRPTGGDWTVTILGTTASLAAGVTCLWASAAAVGIPVSPVAAIVYFAAVTAANNVGPLPAGFGVLDGVLLAWLGTLPGGNAATALSAVLLYRVASAGPVIVMGWVSILIRHRHRAAATPVTPGAAGPGGEWQAVPYDVRSRRRAPDHRPRRHRCRARHGGRRSGSGPRLCGGAQGHPDRHREAAREDRGARPGRRRRP